MHDLGQDLRVLKHRARAQHVGVPRVVLAIGLEDRLLQALEQRLVLDVGVGIVDEDARLHVSPGVDVAKDAPSRYTAADILAVVLEVHGKDRLPTGNATHLADTMEHVLTLLDRWHEVGIGALSHRHVVEVPCKASPFGDDGIKVLI